MPSTRWALRALNRRPLASGLLVVSLALGIGTAAATFGVVDAVLLRPLPFADDERLAFVFASIPEEGVPRKLMSALNLADLAQRTHALESLAAVSWNRTLLLGGEEPRLVRAELVSADYFDTLGVRPLFGRGFATADSGAESVALVSSDLWAGELGAPASLAGSVLTLDEMPFEVVGVMPSTYRGILWRKVDVWLPLAAAPRLLGRNFADDRAFGWLAGLGRLGPGVTADQARRELLDLTAQLEAEHPGPNRGHRAVLEPLRELYFGEDLARALLYLLLAAAGILLLCALNAASLVTSEALARRRELAVLLALGANRRHVFGLFLAPLAVQVLLAGALGMVLAHAGARWLVGLSDLPPASLSDDYVDARVLAVSFAVSCALALALALVPLLVVRPSRLVAEIREGTRSSRRQLRLRAGLATLEVALAVVLLIGAGLMLQSVRAVTGADPGFQVDRLLALDIGLQTARYADLGERRRHAEQLLGELARHRSVAAAAVVGPQAPPESAILAGLELETRGGLAAETLQVYRSSISPSYPDTLGVPLLLGRGFDERDREDAPPVALVSRSAAEILRGNGPLDRVLGMRLRLAPPIDGDPEGGVWTIVGVLGDVSGRGLGLQAAGEHDVYLPFAQAPPRRFHLLARSAGDPEPAARALREIATAVDPQLARNAVETMRARYAKGAADQRFGSVLVGSLAALALVLTAVGFYGLFHLTVRAREQELGVRLSLGARPSELLGMILLHGLRLAAGGLALGLLGSLLLHRWIGSFLYGASATDPLVLGSAFAILLVVASAGSLGPALRAMRIDPARTLSRAE